MGELMACTSCGVREDERLIDGAPRAPGDSDFTDLLCIRCYGDGVPYDEEGERLTVTWAPACEAPSKASKVPALLPLYLAWEARQTESAR